MDTIAPSLKKLDQYYQSLAYSITLLYQQYLDWNTINNMYKLDENTDAFQLNENFQLSKAGSCFMEIEKMVKNTENYYNIKSQFLAKKRRRFSEEKEDCEKALHEKTSVLSPSVEEKKTSLDNITLAKKDSPNLSRTNLRKTNSHTHRTADGDNFTNTHKRIFNIVKTKKHKLQI